MNNGFNAAAQPKPTPRELMLAVERLKEDEVSALLARGADVIETDKQLGNGYTTHRGEGFTTLGYTAFFGKTVLMDMLLAAGAKIDEKDAWGCTPLMNAISNHYPAGVRFLLACGASLEGKNDKGESVWDLAKGSGMTTKMLSDAVESRAQALAAAAAEKAAAERAIRNIAYRKQELLRLLHAPHFTIKQQ